MRAALCRVIAVGALLTAGASMQPAVAGASGRICVPLIGPPLGCPLDNGGRTGGLNGPAPKLPIHVPGYPPSLP